jgi:hypothetical protein
MKKESTVFPREKQIEIIARCHFKFVDEQYANKMKML